MSNDNRTEKNKLVVLDFGQYGQIEVPPELAMSFVSDQGIKDQIRNECRKASEDRRSRSAEKNGSLVTLA